ncbi:CLAVATA3/ESR (CLE)-related protein 19 [Populus alba x Populus x berolinensis]|nr:CLAVATA3/ESR (CLE)-related protein 19 [Populus alba x Populus x berolinensis]
MALSLLIFGSIGRSDAVPKTTFLSPVDGSNKKKSSSNMSPSSSSLEAVNTLFSNSSKNKNITLDEMRVVPTVCLVQSLKFSYVYGCHAC